MLRPQLPVMEALQLSRRWIDMGFTNAEAGDYIEHGIVDPDLACCLRGAAIDALRFASFCRLHHEWFRFDIRDIRRGHGF
jgi:hypothetical protein